MMYILLFSAFICITLAASSLKEIQELSLKDAVSNGIGGGDFLLPNHSKYINSTGSKKYKWSRDPKSSRVLSRKIGEVSWNAMKDWDSKDPSELFSFENTFGRYGGGKYVSGKNRGMKLFSESGKNWTSFSTDTGEGFAGRAHSGLALIEAFHRYKQYKAMLKKYRLYNGYVVNGVYQTSNCSGGCSEVSFCDSGICRCSFGYLHFLGACVKDNIEYKNREISTWNGSGDVISRKSSNFNPYVECSNISYCQTIDINLICSTESKICECREDMMWNEEELQCQIYIDVDCSVSKGTIDIRQSKLISNTTKEKSRSTMGNESWIEDLNPNWDGCVDDPNSAKEAGYDPNYWNKSWNNVVEDANKTNQCPDINLGFSINYKTGKLFHCSINDYKLFCPMKCNACWEKWRKIRGVLNVRGVLIPSYQLSESNDGTLSLDLSTLSPAKTLHTSFLATLELRKTKPIEMKEIFCVEIKALELKYSQPERVVFLSEMLQKVFMNKMKEQKRKEQDFYRKLVLKTNSENWKNQKQTTFSSTNDISDWSMKAFGIFGSIALTFLGSCLFVCCCYCCLACFQTAKSHEQNSQELERTQQEQVNPDIFSQTRASQNNTPHAISPIATSARPESPPPPYPPESPPPGYEAAFLPYPNTGIAYQAPSTNPV